MSMPFNKSHALVVDDCQTTLDIARRFLETDGYRVSTALDGQAAIDIMRMDEPYVVLLGVLMPVMNGLELYHGIREISKTVCIIYRPGSLDKVDPQTLAHLRREAVDGMGKLTSDKEMLNKIERILKIAEQSVRLNKIELGSF